MFDKEISYLNKVLKHIDTWSPENLKNLEEAIISLGSFCSIIERRLGIFQRSTTEDRSIRIPLGSLVLGNKTSISNQLQSINIGPEAISHFSTVSPHTLTTGETAKFLTPFPDGLRIPKNALPKFSYKSNDLGPSPLSDGNFSFAWKDFKNRPCFVLPIFEWGNNAYANGIKPFKMIQDTFQHEFSLETRMEQCIKVFKKVIGSMADPLPLPKMIESPPEIPVIGRMLDPAYRIPDELSEVMSFSLGEGNSTEEGFISGWSPASAMVDITSVKFPDLIVL